MPASVSPAIPVPALVSRCAHRANPALTDHAVITLGSPVVETATVAQATVAKGLVVIPGKPVLARAAARPLTSVARRAVAIPTNVNSATP